MHMNSRSVLTIAVALSLGAQLLAQGDDCSGALSVAQGNNGPYTNVGSTTSSPAWPCALGGNDVWFSYVAPGAGSLTVDTCGGGFDTALELFDGNAGCGALTSLGCNDDSCGLQSSLTVTVNTGDTIFIRVGGFNSSTGSFPLNINGPIGSGTVAIASNYGTGCVARAGSFYETQAPATFDLNNTNMTLIPTSPGYVALPTGAFVTPSGSAVSLGLTDDSEATVPLTTPFVYDGGVTSSLTVCSNGYVSIATGNGVGYIPSTNTMLNNSQTAWYLWHDFVPGAAGDVVFEQIGSIAYITWNGVPTFGSAVPCTFQFQFDSAVGSVTLAIQTMSATSATTAQEYLVGYSPAGPSMDPGSRDISVDLLSSFVVSGNDLPALALQANPRPIAGTTIQMTTNNIGATAAFGGLALGFTNPALNLTPLGMAGCTQYADHLGVLIFVPLGASSYNVPLTIPNAIGVTMLSQSFVYDPSAGLTTLGAVASNGVSLLIGNL